MKSFPLVSVCALLAVLFNPTAAQPGTWAPSAIFSRLTFPIIIPPPRPDVGRSAEPCVCAWTPMCDVRIGALALQRSNPSAVPLVRDGNGNVVFDAGRFNFDYEVGID